MNSEKADQYRLAVILGSVREGRFGPVVAGWFAQHAAHRSDIDVDLVDLAELDDGTRGLAPRIDAADAVVVVVPEYNHSFPGPLKHALDSVGRPWQALPIGFVSYGGVSGGLRAVEQLRLVFAELGAVTIRHTVSFANAHSCFGPDGAPVEEKPTLAADAMLDQLGWWALALRMARARTPYVG